MGTSCGILGALAIDFKFVDVRSLYQASESVRNVPAEERYVTHPALSDNDFPMSSCFGCTYSWSLSVRIIIVFDGEGHGCSGCILDSDGTISHGPCFVPAKLKPRPISPAWIYITPERINRDDDPCTVACNGIRSFTAEYIQAPLLCFFAVTGDKSGAGLTDYDIVRVRAGVSDPGPRGGVPDGDGRLSAGSQSC